MGFLMKVNKIVVLGIWNKVILTMTMTKESKLMKKIKIVQKSKKIKIQLIKLSVKMVGIGTIILGLFYKEFLFNNLSIKVVSLK